MPMEYPSHIDRQGRTAGAEEEQHILDMISQVLFTAPTSVQFLMTGTARRGGPTA